jgi:3-dehydroquinate synthetase/shikimate kinase
VERLKNALGRHVAVVGFMGAGKSTLGAALAARLGRPFLDLDAEVERASGLSVRELFAEHGEAEFRALEQRCAAEQLARPDPAVIALGGGAVLSPETRTALAQRAFTLFVPLDVDEAWRRVREDASRPLAGDEPSFRRLYEERAPLYDDVADATAGDLDDACLAAAGVHVEPGALDRLGELLPSGPVALVADVHVAGIHGVAAQVALSGRDVSFHEVAQGEAAKTPAQLERLWRSLRIGRDGVLVALGGGSTTDLAGFAAATWARGVPWVPVPTTLVGQVDAAIGGKTAIDLPSGKNLVGAFHWPARVVVDPLRLDTLPEAERRNGLAEVVKTGLLAGEPLWELEPAEQVRRCAAFKAAVCLQDLHDRGARAQLNLGHTFAHALEAAADFRLPHGEAVALGLVAALRLSGNEADLAHVERVLRPRPVKADPERAWAALARDKKAVGGVPRLVLLERAGDPRWDVELPEADIRRALESLIQD